MRRITTLIVATVLVMVVLATGVLPANAQASYDAGTEGSRWLPSHGWVYCDNFYDSEWVYWCYSELYGGHWFRVSPTY
jgi:hypothetical protein